MDTRVFHRSRSFVSTRISYARAYVPLSTGVTVVHLRYSRTADSHMPWHVNDLSLHSGVSYVLASRETGVQLYSTYINRFMHYCTAGNNILRRKTKRTIRPSACVTSIFFSRWFITVMGIWENWSEVNITEFYFFVCDVQLRCAFFFRGPYSDLCELDLRPCALPEFLNIFSYRNDSRMLLYVKSKIIRNT